MTDDIWKTPVPSVKAVEHQGGAHMLTTPEQKASFNQMVTNTLIDVMPGYRVKTAPAKDLVLAFAVNIRNWATVPVSWHDVSSVLENELSKLPLKHEDMNRVRKVVAKGFHLAAEGKVEHKPAQYPNGLTGNARREFEEAFLEFFADPLPYHIAGNKAENQYVNERFGMAMEYLDNQMLPLPATRDVITKYAKMMYDERLSNAFSSKMNALYDKLSGAGVATPYVNLENGKEKG